MNWSFPFIEAKKTFPCTMSFAKLLANMQEGSGCMADVNLLTHYKSTFNIMKLHTKSKIILSIEVKKTFDDNFPFTTCLWGNLFQTTDKVRQVGCTAEVKIAYWLQLNIIKLKTQYKIISSLKAKNKNVSIVHGCPTRTIIFYVKWTVKLGQKL